MAKKVLVVTGSPRKNGNADRMAEALIQGAQAGGNTVYRFDAGRKKIGGCTACDKCWSNGQACVFNDDFQELEPLLESCDVLVWATPVYWFGFPAQLKAVIDKLYAYGGAGGLRPLSIKESALLLCGGEAEAPQYEYVADGYTKISSFLGWKDHGVIWQGGAMEPGGINADTLTKAEELGRNL